MERRPSSPSVSNQQASIEEHEQGAAPGTRIEQQESTNVDQELPLQGAAAAFEVAPNPSELEGEEKSGRASTTSPRAEQEEGLPRDTDEQSQDKGKEQETQMSYPGDYYHYSRMTSGQTERERTTSSTIDRRPEMSRSSTNSGSSSNASTPRQGSEAARDNKKDDRSGSGGGSASASTSGSGGGSNRSRLVAGVFVRY